MKKITAKVIIVALLLGLAIVAQIFDSVRRYNIAKELIKDSQSFSIKNENALQRFLVVGDSTAVGTGVNDPRYSTAGRLHTDFPNATIYNKAENGAKLIDIIRQVKDTEGDFDLILIQGGANDILFLTSIDQASESMQTLLDKTTKKSKCVVLVSGGNFSLVPGIPIPLRDSYQKRSYEFLQSFKKSAQENNVVFIDLYTSEGEENAIDYGDDIFYAKDGFHLTNEGYGIWYEHIRSALDTKCKIQ